jgi:hypothetical protein
MIAEITKEKKYQSRAFLILPMSFNVAGILGPGMILQLLIFFGLLITLIVMGGLLADSASTLPGLFGPDGCFGFSWIFNCPYALPSILNAFFLTVTAYIVFFGLEEVMFLQALLLSI